MREGMLWFDNSDVRTPQEKAQRALDYYEGKYLERPTLMFVHPTMLLGGSIEFEDIEVRTTKSVLPNHFWVGR